MAIVAFDKISTNKISAVAVTNKETNEIVANFSAFDLVVTSMCVIIK